jgi:hypothetical protein
MFTAGAVNIHREQPVPIAYFPAISRRFVS